MQTKLFDSVFGVFLLASVSILCLLVSMCLEYSDCLQHLKSQSLHKKLGVFLVFLIRNQPFFRGFEAFFWIVFLVISGQGGSFWRFSLHLGESCNEGKIGLLDSVEAFFLVWRSFALWRCNEELFIPS